MRSFKKRLEKLENHLGVVSKFVMAHSIDSKLLFCDGERFFLVNDDEVGKVVRADRLIVIVTNFDELEESFKSKSSYGELATTLKSAYLSAYELIGAGNYKKPSVKELEYRKNYLEGLLKNG